ncbi:MAG TPA: isochorismatase family cysteine hydrolase [Chloroflexota bacterium]|nr:isochorismatase family cysteine hydrolase [Chloroflexota bacterium]
MADNLRGDDHRSETALLLIDVINDLEFRGGERLAQQAEQIVQPLADLKERAKQAGAAAIYVNDNFGRWKSDFRQILQHCLADGVRGEFIAQALRPDEDDYFILKPKNSAFFNSALDILLDHLGARTLILTGLATNLCVLFTANDAHMRNYQVIVPSDCVAAETRDGSDAALRLMAEELDVEVRPSADIRF